MSIEARVESDLRDEPVSEVMVEQSTIFYCHDVIIGKLIVAWSLANDRGALVHVIEDFPNDPAELTTNELADLANPDNLYMNLLPWFRTKLPIHLDSGEPAELILRHQPAPFIIFRARMNRSID